MPAGAEPVLLCPQSSCQPPPERQDRGPLAPKPLPFPVTSTHSGAAVGKPGRGAALRVNGYPAARGFTLYQDAVKVPPALSLFQMAFGAKKLSLTFLWT